MALLLQISDPHFGTEQQPVVEALYALVKKEKPDVLILSGDITQRALAEQFEAARAFVDRLGIATTLAIPGNHDIPLYNMAARAFAPYAAYSQAFGDELEPSLETDELIVLALNTTRPWRHTDGELSGAQIDRVASRFARASPRQLRIVVTHQPLAVVREEDEHDLLHGHAEAVRRWSAAGADLVVGGHIHLPYVVRLHERDGASRRPFWVVQAGTATSSRVRHEAGNSVNLIRQVAAPDRAASTPAASPREAWSRACDVERWDFIPATATGHAAFERVAVEPMRF